MVAGRRTAVDVVTRMATATVMLVGDDVYEDLFAAGVELQALLADDGLATRVRIGAGSLREQATASDEATPGDDVIALYRAAGELDDDARRGLERAVAAGAGLLAVHSTAYLEDDALVPVIGARYLDHGPLPHESRFAVALAPHPVTAGVEPFELEHEHYRLAVQPGVEVLAWRDAPYGREPLVTVHAYGRGRVCYLQFGHDLRAWGSTEVRRLVTNAARWLARPARTAEEAALPTRPIDAEDTDRP
ncbi:hypothetical protein GCM10009820_18760 [Leifsonia soli]|nr:Trehalose utilisation [Leifsonia sp. 21MFCrub1.1]